MDVCRHANVQIFYSIVPDQAVRIIIYFLYIQHTLLYNILHICCNVCGKYIVCTPTQWTAGGSRAKLPSKGTSFILIAVPSG